MTNYNELSKEELLQILEKKDEEIARKYGIFWDAEKIPEKVVVDCEDNLPVLERVKDKSVKTDETTDNILIEGDNYHALTVLNYTHKEKIDVIYIDPPYNTGNKDFTYNDRYVDKEDGYRHSKWLNFMEKRLNLAKRLLTDKGVVFISIDDNEQAQLKLLCDQVFGEQNFIANLIWKKKSSGGQHSTRFLDFHEYILCYAKNNLVLDTFTIQRSEKQKNSFKLKDDYFESRGKYLLSPLKSWLDYRKTLIYKIQCPDGSFVETQWTCAETTYKELLNDGRIEFKQNKNKEWSVYKKQYETDRGGTTKPPSILDDVGQTATGKRDLSLLFEDKEVFNNPKPTSLIKFLVKIVSQPNSTILDFMAGSGTTGQAVLELNKEDGGDRKFILCTNNELNGVGSKLVDEKRPENLSEEEFESWKQQFGICQRVTYPRLAKIINGYNKNGDGDFVGGLGGNLQYYKTDFVKKVNNRDQIRFNLVNKCTEMLCVKEGIFEIYEEKTNYKIFISNDKKRFLCVYYNFTKFDLQEFAEATEKLNGGKSIYMFADGEDLDLSLFEGIKDCNFEPIPEPILETYRELIKLNITK